MSYHDIFLLRNKKTIKRIIPILSGFMKKCTHKQQIPTITHSGELETPDIMAPFTTKVLIFFLWVLIRSTSLRLF